MVPISPIVRKAELDPEIPLLAQKIYEENGRIVIDNAAKLRIVHEEPIGTKEN